MRDWLLVTGQPGCGKTTAVMKMVEKLKGKYKLKGFYTQEVRQNGTRVGFDIVTMDGKQGILSREKGLPSSFPKTGKYSVNTDSFDKIAIPSLSLSDYDENTIYVLDEVGRMELHSKLFAPCVQDLLDAKVKLVGAVTAPRYGHRVPFCDHVTDQDGVQVHNLKKSNRDEVVAGLLKQIEDRWLQK